MLKLTFVQIPRTIEEKMSSLSHLASECRHLPEGPVMKGDVVNYVSFLNSVWVSISRSRFKNDVTAFLSDMVYVSSWLSRSFHASVTTYRR